MPTLSFVLDDKLPLVYDAVIAIYSVSKKPKCSKRTDAINSYCLALRTVWIKSFGEDHVMPRKSVAKRLENILTDYNNKVVIESQRKTQKKKSAGSQTISKSIHVLNKEWRFSEVPVKKHSRKKDKKLLNNDLLDIGVNMEIVTGREQIFYEDQLRAHECRLSEEIDEEYELEMEARALENTEAEKAKELEQAEAEKEIELENSYIFDDSCYEVVPKNKRKLLCESGQAKCDQEVQVSLLELPKLEIRKVRKTTEEVKNSIATVSVRAGVSVPKACIAVQAVCEKLYNHKYYLSPPLPTIEEADETTVPTSKRPRTSDDYKVYKDVLPFVKTVNEYKHKKALDREIHAAGLLLEKDESTKSTLHFDSTRRSRIDGEWPSLVLNFKNDKPADCHMIRLRPLFFAYEDRDQIKN